jgi:hypothetical protein
MEITWKPPRKPNESREALPASAFAFPKERKEPLSDATHVRSAVARFDQVSGVSDAERAQAFANIKAAGCLLWRHRRREELARHSRLKRMRDPTSY